MSFNYQIGDYHETYRTFKLDVPERYNWAYEVFDAWGQDSSKVAMVWVGRTGDTKKVTFRHLSERSKRVANALIGLGVQPGDKVFIMLPRIIEWWELILGCMRSRTISVPVSYTHLKLPTTPYV